MKSLETFLEPRLAWALWQGLQKFSDLLWERYEKDFLDLAMGEGPDRAMASGLDSEEEVAF